jgi:hypothetical protein
MGKQCSPVEGRSGRLETLRLIDLKFISEHRRSEICADEMARAIFAREEQER